jgi:hypothetical protein
MTIEHTRMFTVGRTVDRCTRNAGWAGWKYERPLGEKVARVIANIAVLSTFALIGLLLAWRG